MSTLQGSWVWYELMSPDPDGSKTFYEGIVGWNMTIGTADSGDYGFITAPDGGMVGGLLKLTKDMNDHGTRPIWLGYIGVDDVDAALLAMVEAGGKALMPARDVPMAGRIAMAADPGGAQFYIMKPTPPPGNEGATSTAFQPGSNSGHCGWNELLAADAAREVGFYTAQFGWTLPEPMDMGAMGQYQFIAHDGVQVGAIMQAPPQVPAAFWNHYFWVSSITEAKTKVEAAGGQVINGPMEVPGGGWILQGIDPQGAMFSLTGGS